MAKFLRVNLKKPLKINGLTCSYFISLGNELKPELGQDAVLVLNDFISLGNELKPEQGTPSSQSRADFISLGNELKPELRRSP